MEARLPSVRPVTVRSKFMLEMASELSGMADWPHRQIRLMMRSQEVEDWSLCLYASDSPEAIPEVARGEVHLAIVNPGSVLALALKGAGPFKEPIPLRAITVLWSYDQLAFAFHERTGINSLKELRDKRYPLRLSIRGQKNHSVHLVVNEVLAAYGFSIDDIVSWGGSLFYHPGVIDILDQVDAIARGEIDAIFDEGVARWTNKALDAGMRVVPLEEEMLQKLESLGFERGVMEKSRFPKLRADVTTLDFSGFIVCTHANTPDDIVRAFCTALEARKDRIPSHSGEDYLPLEAMCRNTPAGPLTIPLHPAAERFWKEKGYL